MPKIKPTLLITYSWIYDKHIHELQKLEHKISIEKIQEYREKLQKKWKKIEKKAFDSISTVSGLAWKKETIDCYLVKNSTPFSMPLTLPMRKDMDELLKTIMHELVHNIVVQNYKKIRKKDYSEKYGELSRKAEIHILIHAILKEAMIKVFGEKETKEYIEKKQENLSDYKIAWDVVEKEGSKRIIKDLIP